MSRQFLPQPSVIFIAEYQLIPSLKKITTKIPGSNQSPPDWSLFLLIFIKRRKSFTRVEKCAIMNVMPVYLSF
jgi:hypothetical protein